VIGGYLLKSADQLTDPLVGSWPSRPGPSGLEVNRVSMRGTIGMIGKAHSLMLRFLLAGSDTLHPRSRSMSSRSNPLLWTRSHIFRKYAIAVLSVAAALILAQWPALHLEMAPVSLFFCAVMLSAWFGGLRPGFLATALSALAFDYYFLPPTHSLSATPEELPRLLAFSVSALVVGALSAAQRSATESLRVARDGLLVTVQELRRTNEALEAESRERARAEEKLRRSEGYLAEAQRLSHTGSWASRPAMDEIRYFSEECYRILGFDPQAGVPRYEAFFQRVHPDDQDKLRTAVETAGRDKAEFELDYRFVRPGGQIRDIHVLGHPVFRPSGDLVEFVGTVMDVTEQKKADEERERLRQAQAELAHINRVTTMGELTVSLAHEVNQPIAAAITDANTSLRWLAGNPPNLEEAREAAMRVVKDNKRAAEIISRIRLLFKKGATERELVDLSEVIREMIVLLRNEASQHSISIRTDFAADSPRVMADRVQLQQVLMNLIMNSIDAMKRVEGARELAIRSELTQDEEIQVSVSDTGVGLPQQQADQIFDAFFTTKVNGTGMGLRISRSIVESHGGRLWAAPNSHRGATFCFTLPTKIEAEE
jgi:PAS domain S-box-containing protein